MMGGRARLAPRADGAHVHDPLSAGTSRGLDHVTGALHVHGMKRGAARLDDDADEVDDRVRAPRERRERRSVRQTAGHELDPETLEAQRPDRTPHQRADRVSTAREHGGDVASHEPGGPGDGDQHDETGQADAVPPSSRNTSVRRRATTDTRASYTLGSSTVPARSAARSTAFSGLIFSW